MGRPRNPNSQTDPALLEYRRWYYQANKNKILEAAKAKYAAKTMVKKQQKKKEKEIGWLIRWNERLIQKLEDLKEEWLLTAVKNQIRINDELINSNISYG